MKKAGLACFALIITGASAAGAPSDRSAHAQHVATAFAAAEALDLGAAVACFEAALDTHNGSDMASSEAAHADLHYALATTLLEGTEAVHRLASHHFSLARAAGHPEAAFECAFFSRPTTSVWAATQRAAARAPHWS